MRAFVVPEGVEVIAVRAEAEGRDADALRTVTKREAMFYREDIRVDPWGSLGPAQGSYYGFELKPNRDGWAMMLVHMGQVQVR